MHSIRNLSCFLVLASSITLCFGSSMLMCPVMQNIPDATVLSLSFWSPMATVDILEPVDTVLKTTIAPVGATTVGPTQPPDEMHNPVVMDDSAIQVTPVNTQSFQPGEQVCLDGGQCYTRIGTMSTSFWPVWKSGSLAFERVLSTPGGSVIGKLTIPGLFGIIYPLETWQEVYSCSDTKVGRVIWDFEWSQLFFPVYDTARLQDNSNPPVDVARIVATENKAFDLQRDVQLAGPAGGAEFAKMQHRFGGLNLGFTHFASKVTIQMPMTGLPVSPPAQEPYVLTLLFANQLAGRMFFGPLLTIVVLLLGCCGCAACCLKCCCGSCCGSCCKKEGGRETKVHPGETESLLSTKVAPEKETGGSMWGCCTRYSAKTKESTTKPPPSLASHAVSEFRSFTSGAAK